MQKTYIIIGASAAGISAVATLHQLDPEAHIMCISKEPKVYNKCLLFSYMQEQITQEKLNLDFMLPQEASITWMYNTEVISVDSERQQITCVTQGNTQTLDYNALFLGIGTLARTIPEYADTPGIFTIHTLEDCQKIIQYCLETTINHAVIVGAGITGLESISFLKKYAHKISIIEKNSHILPHFADAKASAFLEKKLEKDGITCYTNSMVTNIQHQETGYHVTLSSPNNTIRTIDSVNLIIMAMGTTPATDFLKNTGIEFENGYIVTNNYLQTSAPSIFAGGDCIMANNIITGKKTPTRHWRDAVQQGKHAAYSMAGQNNCYPGMTPYTNTTIDGIPVIHAAYSTQEPIQLTYDHDENFYESIAHSQHNDLRGFLLIGKLIKAAHLKKQYTNTVTSR
ncbi:MAG: NAD(P)/FAD-dependent oxidoreductase [Candidatus Babeliaceae bacterium]|jgi:NAD(P)H-nitrite reductase large subunit